MMLSEAGGSGAESLPITKGLEAEPAETVDFCCFLKQCTHFWYSFRNFCMAKGEVGGL